MKTNNLYAQLSVGQGPAGPVGPQGPKGDKGDKGETGPVGPQGPKGDKGERGARGERGLTGPTGLQGERGAQGPEGQRGPQGIQGPKGDKGDTGAQGPKGDRGEKGEKGERGEKGEKGDAGGVLPEDKIDYLGNSHDTLRETMDSNVDFVLGEVNRVHYEGQNITALDSIAGQAKNAVVEGQTLVNLLNNKYIYCNLPTSEEVEMDSSVNQYDANNNRVKEINLNQNLQANKKYLIVLNITQLESGKRISGFSAKATSGEQVYDIPSFYSSGLQCITYTPQHDVKRVSFYLDQNVENPTIAKIKQPMFIEYQEGMENWDIPYFEGMTSVKAPVLKTVGKNLVDDTALKTADLAKENITDLAPIKVEPNKSYYVGLTLQDGKDASIKYFTAEYKDENGIVVAAKYHNHVISFTEEQAQKIKTINIFTNKQHGYSSAFVEHLWVVESSEAVPYEPHKSNILTTPEDLELRGIGDIKDELNISTGEKIERIGEVVLDGSSDENWFLADEDGYTYKRFRTDYLREKMLYSGGNVCNIICDKVVCYPNSTWRDDREGIEQDSLYLSFRKNCETITEFKQYLSQNPITIQYALATPVIKTVDLSDNHVYSYQDTTHYSFEPKANSLIPTLSLDVPTKLNALVARQKDTIQELTQENESLKAAQQVLLNSQLSFYESLVSTIPALMPAEGQVNIPDFIQDLYRLKNNQK